MNVWQGEVGAVAQKRKAASAKFGRSDRSAVGRWFWEIDRVLLLLVAVLISIGLVAVAAASPAAATRYSGIGVHFTPLHYFYRQLIWIIAALPVMIGVSMLSKPAARRLCLEHSSWDSPGGFLRTYPLSLSYRSLFSRPHQPGSAGSHPLVPCGRGLLSGAARPQRRSSLRPAQGRAHAHPGGRSSPALLAARCGSPFARLRPLAHGRSPVVGSHPWRRSSSTL